MRARAGVRLAPFGSPGPKTCGNGRSWEVTGENSISVDLCRLSCSGGTWRRHYEACMHRKAAFYHRCPKVCLPDFGKPWKKMPP